jgi:hypothetical protein
MRSTSKIKTLLAEIASITPADETYDMKIKVRKMWSITSRMRKARCFPMPRNSLAKAC